MSESKKLPVETITTELLAALPEETRAAISSARTWLADACKGRRQIPEPMLVRLPIPEEGEAAELHAVVIIPGYAQRSRIQKLMLQAKPHETAALNLEALDAALMLTVTEAVYWVQGMPETTGPQRGRAVRDYLVDMREERGSLGAAFASFAGAALSVMSDSPEVRLGKLSASATG